MSAFRVCCVFFSNACNTYTASSKFATQSTRYSPRTWIRISITPGPTERIGFQSPGSSPRCTRNRSWPTCLRTGAGKPLSLTRLVPAHTRGFARTGEVYQYLYRCQSPAGASQRERGSIPRTEHLPRCEAGSPSRSESPSCGLGFELGLVLVLRAALPATEGSPRWRRRLRSRALPPSDFAAYAPSTGPRSPIMLVDQNGGEE